MNPEWERAVRFLEDGYDEVGGAPCSSPATGPPPLAKARALIAKVNVAQDRARAAHERGERPRPLASEEEIASVMLAARS